jgi:hypothetical protein
MHKITGKLIKQGHGRKRVMVHKKSFYHPLEGDGCVILDIDDLNMETFPIFDDDGGITEKQKTALLLFGENR